MCVLCCLLAFSSHCLVGPEERNKWNQTITDSTLPVDLRNFGLISRNNSIGPSDSFRSIAFEGHKEVVLLHGTISTKYFGAYRDTGSCQLPTNLCLLHVQLTWRPLAGVTSGSLNALLQPQMWSRSFPSETSWGMHVCRNDQRSPTSPMASKAAKGTCPTLSRSWGVGLSTPYCMDEEISYGHPWHVT